MARKKKHPEHVNLERYLISYADFITLLFATFVVLYALSQVDIQDFKALEDSIQKAFSAPSLMQGADGIMQDKSATIMDNAEGETLITPLMMEYMSQKYEEQSFEQIQKDIDKMAESGELDGVETTMTDRGMLISFNCDSLFTSGSASLTTSAKQKLDKVGATIGKKFILHYMRIEGHTDNQPIVSSMYPSNWELSSARASSIIRYFINRFSFMPGLFTAVGFADTRSVESNATPAGRAKNRRVDVLILKNQFKNQESPHNDIMKLSSKDQELLQARRLETISKINIISGKTAAEEEQAAMNAAILNQSYEKELHRLSKETGALDKNTKSKITGEGVWLKAPPNPELAPKTQSNSSRGGIANQPKYKEAARTTAPASYVKTMAQPKIQKEMNVTDNTDYNKAYEKAYQKALSSTTKSKNEEAWLKQPSNYTQQ